MAIGMESETQGRSELNESLRMNPLNGYLPLIGEDSEAQRRRNSPWSQSQDCGLLAHPPSLSPRDASPFSGLPPPRTGDPRGERGLFPWMALVLLIMSSLP